MAQTIKLKRSAQEGNVPSTSQLALGEMAINTTDGLIFIKKGDNSIIQVNNRTTDDLDVGSNNLYFTNALARAAFSATGDLDYNQVTGVFNYDEPDNLSHFNNDISEVTSTVPTDGTGKPTGYVWYIV